MALAEANIEINGISTPEFALADAGKNEIFVKLGVDSKPEELQVANGLLNNPQSVTLADVNGDGIPDLVVANTGGNNVLVFLGLADGLFGPEVNGGKGFAVGDSPVSVTVGDLNRDGTPDLGVTIPDLIVANAKSNSVTILDGQGSGSNWTATVGETIQVGQGGTVTAPVRTALVDVNGDGDLDLFVCNSASDNVYLYTSQGNGNFNTSDPTIIAVGQDPSDMLLGQFDKHQQLDLLTVNSNSNDLTFVGGVLNSHPTIETVSSGGILPDAAFAIDPGHNGVMDVVVANGGDGHLALLQGVNDGMQIAGVITQANIPVPTGLAATAWSESGIDLFAATAGEDVAQLFHFDLNTTSNFLATPAGINNSGDELIAQLLTSGDSGLEMVAVFWTGSSDSALSGESSLREPSTITALYSPTEGQGTEETTPTSAVTHDPQGAPAVPTDPSQVDPSLWARFVFGLDAALKSPEREVEAVASRDALEPGDEPPMGEIVQLERPPTDPDVEAASVDEALRLFWSEGRTGDGAQPVELSPSFDSIRHLDGIDAPALDGQLDTVPLISLAVLISTRLILKATPPRPPSIRKGAGRRGIQDRPAGGPGGPFDQRAKK